MAGSRNGKTTKAKAGELELEVNEGPGLVSKLTLIGVEGAGGYVHGYAQGAIEAEYGDRAGKIARGGTALAGLVGLAFADRDEDQILYSASHALFHGTAGIQGFRDGFEGQSARKRKREEMSREEQRVASQQAIESMREHMKRELEADKTEELPAREREKVPVRLPRAASTE